MSQIPSSTDVGVMADAKALLADVVEVWWSRSTAIDIRKQRLRQQDVLAAYKIRDFLNARDAELLAVLRAVHPILVAATSDWDDEFPNEAATLTEQIEAILRKHGVEL